MESKKTSSSTTNSATTSELKKDAASDQKDLKPCKCIECNISNEKKDATNDRCYLELQRVRLEKLLVENIVFKK